VPYDLPSICVTLIMDPCVIVHICAVLYHSGTISKDISRLSWHERSIENVFIYRSLRMMPMLITDVLNFEVHCTLISSHDACSSYSITQLSSSALISPRCVSLCSVPTIIVWINNLASSMRCAIHEFHLICPFNKILRFSCIMIVSWGSSMISINL
jgi:hypothetical protein